MDGFKLKMISSVMSVISLFGSALCGAKWGDGFITELNRVKGSVTVAAPTAQEVSFTPDAVLSAGREILPKNESESEDKAIADTPNGKKLGKILSQFFDPETANVKWNGIHLNNQSGVNVDIKKSVNSGYMPTVEVNSQEPQVLIVHTHATESYIKHEADYYTESDLERTKREGNSVIGVGNRIEKLLTAAGIKVLHDKTLHDSPSYSDSYTRSSATVSEYLKKYDSIKVILDIHRDAIGSGDDIIKPITEIEGKKAAQVMICVGSETGTVEGFPRWQDNLSFGLRLQQALEVMYPGLARPLFLAHDRLYTQNLSPGSLIIEFGTNANTFSEADYSARLVAKALITLFKT